MMYEYVKNNYVYYGNKECGTPIKEIKVISEKEAKYWDNLEKEIKRLERMK